MSRAVMKLGEFAEVNPRTSLEQGRSYPYLGMADVPEWQRNAAPSGDRRFTGSGTKFIAGDTLLARITPCLENGKTCIAGAWASNGAFGSTEYIVFRARRGVSDARFIYYLARSHLVRETAIASMVGSSGRQRARAEVLAELELRVPSIAEQERISDILSSYDDLIENNNRRMLILEEQIHQLYREWFVFLRFPGRDRVSVANGVPMGWKRAPVREVIAFNPDTTIAKDRPCPFVPMNSLSTTGMLITPIEERVPGGGAKFRNGDTLLARITPCLENGKTGFVQFMESPDDAASGSTEFIVMRGLKVPATWVYCLARSSEFRQEAINRMSGSDGRQRVDWKAIAELEVLLPSPVVAAEFDDATREVFRQIHLLSTYNDKLREGRDLLLPRLLDGRIPV